MCSVDAQLCCKDSNSLPFDTTFVITKNSTGIHESGELWPEEPGDIPHRHAWWHLFVTIKASCDRRSPWGLSCGFTWSSHGS